MQIPLSLDPDLLRAFAFIAEEGSFTRAAQRVGRTQSAVSMQVQRLESVLGQRLLLRGRGGTVQLTPHGEYLLARARELLALNDEIYNTFRMPDVAGRVRLGTPDDYALRYLPPILRRFADGHPAVDVDVVCASSEDLVARLCAGELDLTLCTETLEPPGWEATLLWRGPLRWITAERSAPHRLDPLPLALAGDHCAWRRAAVVALERARRPYRVAYTSATQAGTFAPVLAGLAITVSTVSWVPDGLRVMRPDEGLPALPAFGIVMMTGRQAAQPVTDALAAHIADTFRAEAEKAERAPAA